MGQDTLEVENEKSQGIQATLIGKRIIIWNSEHGSELYGEGYYGKPLGIRKPKSPHFTVPLELSFLEAKYLLEKGRIVVISSETGELIDSDTLTTIANKYYELFGDNYVVYNDLREHGYVIRPGLKFGCDMAVYEQGPGIDHSPFLVSAVPKGTELSPIHLVRAGRLATSVRKRFVIAMIFNDNQVKYYAFSWFKP